MPWSDRWADKRTFPCRECGSEKDCTDCFDIYNNSHLKMYLHFVFVAGGASSVRIVEKGGSYFCAKCLRDNHPDLHSAVKQELGSTTHLSY